MPMSFHETLAAHFSRAIPHALECGMQVDEINPEYVISRLAYRDEWLGDTERGVIHTGVVTTLVDTSCGLALLAKLERFEPIATLDLRMDYLRPAFRDRDIVCRAECYRITESIAFVRASAWQDKVELPIASAHSAFMRSASRRRRRP